MWNQAVGGDFVVIEVPAFNDDAANLVVTIDWQRFGLHIEGQTPTETRPSETKGRTFCIYSLARCNWICRPWAES